MTSGNGAGKPTVYRAPALLQHMAEGRFDGAPANSVIASCNARMVKLVPHYGETRPQELAGVKRAWSCE